ncbi:AfsR/SARP family transcriptional regulator [Nocardiopsis composta]|uniref:Tetratricopeptide (TPR) repeat protein/DNA-binding SARP family transcriptional activator n=3 Tax=Nocardiopsis composta TaxID=157465 RepID=A0A7W8QHT5_9ACTN|nr:tetratricopeptide repeat protein [Nocardiopsis composta]MBB5430738.1 tetratricopeptide (TPR) repeat protein/DNA-binding SARP family transcriptional activator [Nocardiopsis composta]
MDLIVLGPVALRAAGRTFPLGSGRQLEIAVFLALSGGRAISREIIIDRIWNGEGGKSSTLDSYISRTRRRLEAAGADRSALVCRNGAYSLRLAHGSVDWLRFRKLRHRAQVLTGIGDPRGALALLDEALGLWQGAPLADVPGHWADAMRRRMIAEHRAALADAGQLALDTGEDPGTLVERLARYAEEYPEHDPLTAQFTEALRRASPAAPPREGPAAAPAAPAPRRVPDTVPGPPPDFHGRRPELELLAEGAEGTAPLQVVHGMPGVGKTALVRRAARMVRPRFPDGTLMAVLHGGDPARTPRDPGEVLYELLAAVGLAPADVPEGTEARAALWRTVTASRRCLLVLDDAAGPEQVRPLLPGGDGCAVVVTSRWRPDGLEGARLLHLAPPPLDEAVRLLADAAGCDPALHRDRLVALARGLGRLPLALRVAAEGHRRAPADPPGARPSPLPAEGRGGAVLQVLDGAFDACLAALSPAARTAFVRLGLLPSPVFGVQAAAAAMARPARQAGPLLDELRRASLLDDHGADARLCMHDLVAARARRGAEEELTDLERHAVLSRTLDHFWAAAVAADRARFPHRHRPPPPRTAPVEIPDFGAPAEATAWFLTERPVLLRLLPGDPGGPADPAFGRKRAGIAQALAGLLAAHGPWDAAARGLERAAGTLREQGETARLGHVLAELAAALLRVGRTRAASACAAEGAAAARACDDDLLRARCLSEQGLALLVGGSPDEALPFLEDALAIACEHRHRPSMADALERAACCRSMTGDPERALDSFEKALTLYRDVGDISGQAKTLSDQASALSRSGRPDEALRSARAALPLMEQLGEQRAASRVASNLGELHAEAGDHETAVHRFRAALATARSLGDADTEFAALCGLGRARTALGDPLGALAVLGKAQRLAAGRAGGSAGAAEVLLALGTARLELGDAEAAGVLFMRSAEEARTPEDRGKAEAALDRLALHRRPGALPRPSASGAPAPAEGLPR